MDVWHTQPLLQMPPVLPLDVAPLAALPADSLTVNVRDNSYRNGVISHAHIPYFLRTLIPGMSAMPKVIP